MNGADLAILLGVLAGGATPLIEGIVAIPGGILAGVHPIPVVITGIIGNLATVAVAAWFGERIRVWWSQRRRAKQPQTGPVESAEPSSKRRQRTERVVRRWGLPALAAVGPVGFSTQLSALVAVGIGITARTTFIWIAAGTLAWGVVAAVVTLTGMSLAGLGG